MERMPATSGSCSLSGVISQELCRNVGDHGSAEVPPPSRSQYSEAYNSACSQQGQEHATWLTTSTPSCRDWSMPAVPRVSRFWTHLKAVFSQDLYLHFLFLQYMRSSPSAGLSPGCPHFLALSSLYLPSSEKWEQNSSEELVRKIELTYSNAFRQCLAPRVLDEY